MLMNVSSLFTLTDLTARLEVPEDALSPVAPAGGSIALPDIGPETDATGQFILRGDVKGSRLSPRTSAARSGLIPARAGRLLGSASTDLEVKGPPKLDVKVTHPDHVIAGQPYDLVITIRNTDDCSTRSTRRWRSTSAAARSFIDDSSGEEIEGRGHPQHRRHPARRDGGADLPRDAAHHWPITSCVGAADANIQLSVGFLGRDPGCAIGTLPSDRLSPDGKPTVTVVPAHNTLDVPVDPAVVALFSARMIEATITTGYPGATFN